MNTMSLHLRREVTPVNRPHRPPSEEGSHRCCPDPLSEETFGRGQCLLSFRSHLGAGAPAGPCAEARHS